MNKTDPGLKEFKADFSGRVVLVTGASRGIGRAIALAFARAGAKLVIHARNQERLAAVAAEIKASGTEVLSRSLDVTNEEEVIAGIDEAERHFGSVHILVNNAGIYQTLPMLEHPTEIWHSILNTNLTAAFVYARQTLKRMLDNRWGRIINISSISGKHAEIHGAAYSASKFALIGLTQSLALEVADKGVTVNAICPGWVDTDMARGQLLDPEWCKLNSVNAEESLENARLSIPQMRFIQAEEVADLALYLAGDSGRGITGQAINVCGGMCLS